jgi:hypothetical protein
LEMASLVASSDVVRSCPAALPLAGRSGKRLEEGSDGRGVHSWVVPLDPGAPAWRLVALFTATRRDSKREAGGVGPRVGTPFQ